MPRIKHIIASGAGVLAGFSEEVSTFPSSSAVVCALSPPGLELGDVFAVELAVVLSTGPKVAELSSLVEEVSMIEGTSAAGSVEEIFGNLHS
jgi:hypothetical protein